MASFKLGIVIRSSLLTVGASLRFPEIDTLCFETVAHSLHWQLFLPYYLENEFFRVLLFVVFVMG